LLRIIDWNISYQGFIGPKFAYLSTVVGEVAGRMPCVISLQEVKDNDLTYLKELDLFNSLTYSLNFRKPGMFEGKNRSLGNVIACCGSGIEISRSALLNRAPFPERTLLAEIKEGHREFEVVCFWSLTGVGYKRGKSAQFAALADYLHEKSGAPIILCLDANEPKIDHYNLEHTEFFDQKGDKGQAASYVLGSNPSHELKDAYRSWLVQNPKLLQEIKKIQENNEDLLSLPLAVSHIAGGKTHKRYDYIFHSNHWKVNQIEYRYHEAIEAGSDHAMVVADLGWVG